MITKNKPEVSIIGAGRLGGALAIALSKKGYSIKSLVSRGGETAREIAGFLKTKTQIFAAERLSDLPASDIVFICTPDPQIGMTAERLAENLNFTPETVFLHTSGSLSSEILEKLKPAKIGSMHPLVSVSDAGIGAAKFAGAYFCVEGGEIAVQTAKQIVSDLGGSAFELETRKKTLYHAAAVMAAGHMVALFDVASELLSNCGLEKNEAHKILLPLTRSAVVNLENQSTSQALTGTFARADLETMLRHLATLETEETALQVYRELGLRSIELAREQGADAQKLDEMLLTLTGKR